MKSQTKDHVFNFRGSVAQRELIDRAAAATGQTRTDFMLDSACDKAREVIMDQRHFVLDDAAFEAFTQDLKVNSLEQNTALKELLARPKPWATSV